MSMFFDQIILATY